jgi:hypothetical protein
MGWLAVLVLVGCADQPQPDPARLSAAVEQQYEANVAPLLEAHCGQCHGESGGTPSIDYATIVSTPSYNGGADPASSALLVTPTMHAGGSIEWSPDAAQTILGWLEALAETRD